MISIHQFAKLPQGPRIAITGQGARAVGAAILAKLYIAKIPVRVSDQFPPRDYQTTALVVDETASPYRTKFLAGQSDLALFSANGRSIFIDRLPAGREGCWLALDDLLCEATS